MPYLIQFKGILWFLFLFILFDFIWKLCIHADPEDESILLFLGIDVTAYFEGLCLWTTRIVYWVIHTLLGYKDFHMEGITLYFTNSLPVDIIWSCTGLKQQFMFLFIMSFYFGPWKKKLWFIPISLIFLLIINILRLTVIFLIIKNPFPEWFISVNEWYNDRIWDNTRTTYRQFYNDWFNVFHRDIFTWIYYDGIILLLWLFWEEKFNRPFQKLRNKVISKTDKTEYISNKMQ